VPTTISTTTVSATATISAATATISAAAATTAATTAGVGKVDFDTATVELVILGDGTVRFIFSGKRYEAKATGAASVAIAHHNRVRDVTKSTEEGLKGFIGRRPVNKANERKASTKPASRFVYAGQDGKIKSLKPGRCNCRLSYHT
jgi:hypothetical protein